MSEQVADSRAVLTNELEQVQQEVVAALGDLRAPFSQLVQSQLRGGPPLLCAAFVLTAGIGPVETPRLAQQRVDLGAALEVLRLALAVHTQLLTAPEGQGQIDRSLLGSTILAGDFCFSRAAALAARTGSPVVVDIFAQALQRVSEGTLRGIFDADRNGIGSSDVERELCLSGVAAANELAGFDAPARQADQETAALLLDARRTNTLSSLQLPPALLEPHTPARAERWQALLEWLRS